MSSSPSSTGAVALTKGVHHVGLTVSDLEASQAFFVDVLGFKLVGTRPEYPASYVSDGVTMLTLWRASEPVSAREFDRHKGIGLHHLCLAVGDGALDEIAAVVANVPSCEIEFEPTPASGGPRRHMMIAIPGSGIRVELREVGP